MKRNLLLSLVALALVGCGASPSPLLTANQAAPNYAMEVAVAGKGEAAKTVLPAAADALASTLDQLKALSRLGVAIDEVETLTADDAPAYAVAAKPETSQKKADAEALKWAADSRQLYLGWGFKWFSLVGTSRHAYYSPSLKKLLLLDYNWLGWKKRATAAVSPVYAQAAALLSIPHDNYLYDCKKCFNIAKDAGYENKVQNCRAFMVNLSTYGPQWIFLDGTNRPQVIVNASTGLVTTSGPLFDALKFLFTITL